MLATTKNKSAYDLLTIQCLFLTLHCARFNFKSTPFTLEPEHSHNCQYFFCVRQATHQIFRSSEDANWAVQRRSSTIPPEFGGQICVVRPGFSMPFLMEYLLITVSSINRRGGVAQLVERRTRVKNVVLTRCRRAQPPCVYARIRMIMSAC